MISLKHSLFQLNHLDIFLHKWNKTHVHKIMVTSFVLVHIDLDICCKFSFRNQEQSQKIDQYISSSFLQYQLVFF